MYKIVLFCLPVNHPLSTYLKHHPWKSLHFLILQPLQLLEQPLWGRSIVGLGGVKWGARLLCLGNTTYAPPYYPLPPPSFLFLLVLQFSFEYGSFIACCCGKTTSTPPLLPLRPSLLNPLSLLWFSSPAQHRLILCFCNVPLSSLVPEFHQENGPKKLPYGAIALK